MTWRQFIIHQVRNIGYDITRYLPHQHPEARLARMIDFHQIGLVLDVGANSGQYVKKLRQTGYRGRAISFEPLKDAFAKLKAKSDLDPLWESRNSALGDGNGTTEINVAGNSTSSSLLNMLPSHGTAAPSSKYVGKEQIQVQTLDSIWSTLGELEGNIWLKLDTQGFEKQVLDGARENLSKIACIQIEMSLVPLYAESAGFNDLLQHLLGIDYHLIGLLPGFSDKTSGHMLQVDGIFAKS